MMILETGRLVLRELEHGDFPALCAILQDDETMQAYEGAFSDAEVMEWLEKQMRRYCEYGFGLWAVVLKGTRKMIGQCGLTLQQWNGSEVLEVGMPSMCLMPGKCARLSGIAISHHKKWH